MSQSAHSSHYSSFSAARSLGWLVFAAALTGAAGWGAYYWLGGWDTPLKQAYVFGAGLLGFGLAAWFNKLIPVILYAAFLVLLIYVVGTYISR